VKEFSDEQLEKLAQDTTNEIWSGTMRREYRTPGERKRAIKQEILSIIRYVNNPKKEYEDESRDDGDNAFW
jgi:hypothetical protein